MLKTCFNLPAAIMCTDLADPTNGDIMFISDNTAPYEFATTATYQCDAGYGLNAGDEVRTCGGDGSSTTGVWSGNAPTCEGMWHSGRKPEISVHSLSSYSCCYFHRSF